MLLLLVALTSGAWGLQGAPRSAVGFRVGFRAAPVQGPRAPRCAPLRAKATAAEKVEKKLKWQRLGSLVQTDTTLLVWAAVFLAVAAVADVATPHFASAALNAIVANAAATRAGLEPARSVSRELIGLGAASAAAAIFSGLRGASFWIAGVRVVSRLRRKMFGSLLSQELGFFDGSMTGDLNSRLSSDATKVADVVSFNLNILARQAIQAAGGVGYLLYLDLQLALVALAWMGAASVATDAYGRYARTTAKRAQDALAGAATVADEALRNIRVVRSLGAERQTDTRYGDAVAETTRLQTRHGVAYGLSRVAVGFTKAGSTIALLALGARRVAAGQIDVERLVTFIFYAAFVNGAAFDVGEQWAKVEEALGAGTAAFNLAYRQPVWDGKSAPSALLDGAAQQAPKKLGRIERDAAPGIPDVRFSYPSRREERVLAGVTIVVEPGQKVALVGSSGSGKSTLTKLLLRHYEPTGGRVTLDGIDVRDLRQADLASRVAYVEQEPQLFSGTLAENIRFGLEASDPRASRACVEDAARRAGVAEFASQLPLGLDTAVGEGGCFQSGGQRQRVAIARALVRNPDVIVLDEPSSALDARSEELVQVALDGTACSMVVVAHRLATIASADRIYVLADGAIIEQGTHQQLIRGGGTYAAMVEKQSMDRPDNDAPIEKAVDLDARKRAWAAAEEEDAANVAT